MMIKDLSRSERVKDMDPRIFGEQPFLLRPGNFAVIDGDTIWAWANNTSSFSSKKRECAFSMRFRSIAAPEKPVRRATDSALKAAGIDPYWDSAGKKATDLLKTYLDGRALLVLPTGDVDKYGRMLCDMAVVPYTGADPDLSRAVSLEVLMLQQGVVSPFRQESPPRLHPQVCENNPSLC
jgi:endonuclease YncB( thermonuclease family)